MGYHLPPLYRDDVRDAHGQPIIGLPIPWHLYMASGLNAAVRAYLYGGALSLDAIDRVGAFLVYWLDAPCWRSHRWERETDRAEYEAELDALTERAHTAFTRTALAEVVAGCIELGIDPL